MAKSLAQLKHPFAKIVGDFPTEDVFVISAHIKEGLTKIAEMRVVFAIKHNDMELDQMLGKTYTVEVKTKGPDDADKRNFTGTCIEAEFLGLAQGYDMFTVELRAWPWFLTQMQNNRIFQDKSIPEIIKAIFSERGFSDYEDKLHRQLPAAQICRAIRRDRLRLHPADDGRRGDVLLLRLVGQRREDGAGRRPRRASADRRRKQRRVQAAGDEGQARRAHHLRIRRASRRWCRARSAWSIATSRIRRPRSTSPRSTKRGTHSHKSYEQYRMHGHYGTASQGEHYARVAVDAHAHEAGRFMAATNVRERLGRRTFT